MICAALWSDLVDESDRRAKKASPRIFAAVRDETAALTEEIARAKREIDERVAALYGVQLINNG